VHAEADTGAACIAPEDHGARLDAALARLLPQLQSQLLPPLPPPNQSPNGAAPTPPLLPPGAGLRARRRLWLTHAVLLDGRAAQPGTRVRAGQRVELRPLGTAHGKTPGTAVDAGPHDEPDISRAIAPDALPDAARNGAENPADAPRVLAEADGLVALYKPGGLHSAAIAGSAAPSVEALLPALLGLPGLPGLTDIDDPAAPDASRPLPGTEAPAGFPCLLNRLDGPTSGILLAARTPQAAARFHAAENSSHAAKTYLALVHGVLAHPATMRRALDTANRATTRVLPQDTSDPLRHTGVTPLGVMQTTDMPNAAPCPSTLAGYTGQDSAPASACTTHAPGPASPACPACTPGMPGTPCTLVRCVIHKGARHQIRAHLAALGHPIVGDTRYGTPDGTGTTAPMPPSMPPDAPRTVCPLAPATLFLHHARIELPDFRAACPPPWLHLLPPELQEAACTAYRLDS
jgi:23S rRNA pseudouridine1911/1915/1917 synthase